MASFEINNLAKGRMPSEREEFTLYVNNLPGELNEHGILQIFNHYGQVTQRFFRPNLNWAYITYGSFREAENAIRDLHNVPPLHLQISFAREKNFNKIRSIEPTTFNNIIEENRNVRGTDTVVSKEEVSQPSLHSKLLNTVKKIKPNSDLPQYTYTADDDLLYPYPTDPYTYNPYENIDVYASTNTLWTRGQLTITRDGKRHVSLGRGYTMYEIPAPDPEIYNQINKVYEQRTSGLYEYGEDMLKNSIGSCKTCSKKTKFTCEKCYTFYCSRDCQVMDWPQHKFECEAKSATVKATTPVTMSHAGSEEHLSQRVSNITFEKEKIGNKLEEAEVVKELQKSIKRYPQLVAEDVQKMEENISFTKSTFLSKSEFMPVKIVIKENQEFWVQKVDDEHKLAQLMISLQEEAERTHTIEPIVGCIYAVKYEDIWHRALITSANPTTVHYIDYGNTETITSKNIRKIEKYQSIPQFSAKIRLSQKANEKYNDLMYEDILNVKMLSTDATGVINVEVEGENNVSMSSELFAAVEEKTSNSLNKLQSIVNTVKIKDNGLLEIHATLKNNTYSITLLPSSAMFNYSLLFADLQTACEQAVDSSNHKPNVGDLVCGQRIDGDWVRGQILDLQSPLKMTVIDEARVMPVKKTVSCIKEFLHIPAFGAVCEIPNSKYDLKPGEHYKFQVIEKKSDKNYVEAEIEILHKENIIKAYIKPWTEMPEQKGVQYAQLESGSEVVLASYRNHVHLFVRPLNIKKVEQFNRVMQSVAKCAQTSSFLKEPPVVGEMVIAQYVDENFYRAIVTKIEDNNIAVSYVDFGNTEVTSIKKLKTLPDDLKQIPSCVAKIILKDVPEDVPMTKEANHYLAHLVGTTVPLRCTFDGIPSKDGVYLKLSNEESVNKKVKELLMQTTKETVEADKTCYMMEDLDFVSLGNVGDTVEALILHSLGNNKYAMCPLDRDLITHICVTMTEKIEAYCKISDYYIPREGELCLAYYSGNWCRAACISREYGSSKCNLLLVDHGIYSDIDQRDMRLMAKEFLSAAALASLCNITNVPSDVTNGQLTRKVEKNFSLDVYEAYKVKIISQDLKTNIYDVQVLDSCINTANETEICSERIT